MKNIQYILFSKKAVPKTEYIIYFFFLVQKKIHTKSKHKCECELQLPLGSGIFGLFMLYTFSSISTYFVGRYSNWFLQSWQPA